MSWSVSFDLFLVLLLAEVFENLRKLYLEIHKLDPAKLISAPDLALQAALKNT